MKLVLASKSIARINMLKAAGLEFEAIPADIDESLEQQAGSDPQDIAQNLAAQKALAVAAKTDALVIGADQVLELEGEILTKAENEDQAREKLKTLRGKTHHLISAVCVAKDGKVLWQQSQTASLKMAAFDDAFLQSYLEKAGPALTRSVGAYELESLGVRLFEEVKGDYFTILGMPLLPLLTYLKNEQGLSL